ncbi:sulfurtransferase [Humibacillus sp. DSM 29435]|uniref:rhodanese-like domain-containing protein n=1 Tax=Humibacillus sp. DSM 29435 TaxID=1869167 RepID=UPI000871F554|nr:rhodanese-like domain-containing protein [Humibacillus sp. DSM 29435]OFE15529.1 sulfurtransferase [Humibacillus sp. DSM 29435]
MTYAGDVTPDEAWVALRDQPDAVLVDVRTRAEWAYVGLPDLGVIGKDVVQVEWQSYPDGGVNDLFTSDLEDAGVAHDQSVYFLCRSGVRSIAAAEAATRDGWAQAYNVLEGFEGPPDDRRHRSVAGWKVTGLPWVQG